MTQPVRRRITLFFCLIGVVVATLTAPGPDGPRVDAKLDQLLRMSDKEQARYLASHPAATVAFLNVTPQETAEWWAKRSIPDQDDAVRVLPKYVGNLEGIDYTTRDTANRTHLKNALVAAKKAVAANPTPTAIETLTSLTAIRSSITGHRTPHRYLVQLTTNTPPLAAIAVGNLDTAEQVTFNIPGMGTYTNDMQAWTQTAQNVWDLQRTVGAPKKRAVVAWVGYVTPPVGFDAVLGDYAARGAPRLTTALKGFRAARKHTAPTPLSVIAHSYGTTTAADAIADSDENLYAFVMLGSAGVEERIESATSLNAEHVYAGHAARDGEAGWGIVTRQDPRAPSFGATILSVDGDPELGLEAVTGHDPVLHSKWNDNRHSPIWTRIKKRAELVKQYDLHSDSFGYLDQRTESLRNAAIATTPHATKLMSDGD